MVRRLSVASLDSGAESPEYGEVPSASAGSEADVAAKPPWGGRGGRWAVWPMRVVLWAAILIVGYRGISAIVLNETPSSGPADGVASGSAAATGFPVALGEAFATRFGEIYLNVSPSTATRRAQQLAAFIPANVRPTDPEFGWSGSGTFTLQSLQLAGIDVQNAQTAVVTLLATVDNRLIELGVPLHASGGQLVVSGEPALLPAPSAAALPSAQPVSSDPAAQQALQSQLPGFFQAYASGDQAALSRYLAPGVVLRGLGGAVSFGSITSIDVPKGGQARDITVTVNWMLPGQGGTSAPLLATTYDMSVVDQQSGRWYVRGIRASTQPMRTMRTP